MVFLAPTLIYDVGFQLSFLATAGLVLIQPRLEKINLFIFKSQNFSSTLAAQITTLPILINNFGQFNLLSPLVNFAVLWVIPLILQVGFVVGILSLLFEKIALWSSYLIFPMTFYLDQVISLFAKLTVFQVSLFKISIILSFLYYLAIGLIVFKKSKQNF